MSAVLSILHNLVTFTVWKMGPIKVKMLWYFFQGNSEVKIKKVLSERRKGRKDLEVYDREKYLNARDQKEP